MTSKDEWPPWLTKPPSLALGPGWSGDDGLGLGGIGRPNNLVLSALHLGDEHGMGVLTASVELHRTERSIGKVERLQRVADWLWLRRLGILDGRGRHDQRGISLHAVIGRMSKIGRGACRD